MATPAATQDVFDFFGLARELRDLIYRELPSPSIALHDLITGLAVVAQHVPKTNLLLANRQFKHEYLATAEKATMIVIEDRLNDPEAKVHPYVPASLVQTRALHFNLHISCERSEHDGAYDQHCPTANEELVAHGHRIEGWAKALPCLRSVTVDLHMQPHDEVRICRSTIATNYSKLTSLKGMMRLDVYYNDFESLNSLDEWDYGKGTGPVMKWTAESGVLVDLGNEPEDKEEAVADA